MADFTYTYDDRNRPLTKIGDVVIVTGTNAGLHAQTTSLFSYYD